MNHLDFEASIKAAHWAREQGNRRELKSSSTFKSSWNKKLDYKNVYKEEAKPISDSQDFCLRLSDESFVTDMQNTNANNEKDIIVISDSSSDSSSPRYSNKDKQKFHEVCARNTKVYILESSDSDEVERENEKCFQLWKKHNSHTVKSSKDKIPNWSNSKKKPVTFTSDESSCSNKENNDMNKDSTNRTNSTHVSLTPKITKHCEGTINKATLLLEKKYTNETNFLSKQISESLSFSSHLNNNGCRNTPQIKLTKTDAKNIFRNLKSTKQVYESPRVLKEKNTITDESLDDEIHPAFLPKTNAKEKNKIIDETLSDLDSNIIQASQENLHKIHINRFLDPLNTNKEVDIMGVELSERKKKQISQWLLANSPDSKSDSSISNIPVNLRNSIGSGNSSLERLELNYETPNNRGKISSKIIDESETIASSSDRIINSAVSKQTTIDDFIERSNDKTAVLRTPKTVNPKINKPLFNPTTANTPINVDVMDCADILDNLYGNLWRPKADALLPKSEPKKQVIPKRNRIIETERKVRKAEKYRTAQSADESDTSLKSLNSRQKSTKKDIRKKTRKRDSFINDQSSSESGCESLYYTALTNPRISTKSIKSKTKSVPVKIQRAIAICDSDTEDAEDRSSSDRTMNIRKKRLSFSEDESSSTSEFDPGDYIPPKLATKKESTKTQHQAPKTKTATDLSASVKNQPKKTHSFLASLSENVPISNVHPEAKKYRTDFKNNKESLCKYLFKLYNEKVFDNKLPEFMSIEWNVRMRGTAGFCYNKKSLKSLGGIVKSSRIVLATKIIDTPDRLRDTLIHEMCHAAAWLINNVSDGHGPFWTGWANKAMAMFPELPTIRRCHDYKIKTKFTYKCVGCGYSIGRHSKSLDIEKKRCGHCYGKFELLLNKTTKSGTVQVQTPKREPNAFALFVKENYNSVKKQGVAKHAEVMQLLSKQFSAVKLQRQQNVNIENEADNSA